MVLLDDFGAKVYTVLAKLREEGYFMLEEKDLQAIAVVVKDLLAEERKATDTRLEAMQNDLRREMKVLIENRIGPQLKLLAEGQQDILRELRPTKDKVEAYDTDLVLLKGAVRELSQRVSALEAQK